MTIEQLALRAGVATSTIRLYQARRLLPAPRRVGRVGRYDPGHLERLDLIARLQQEGFSLAAIKRLADAWDADRDLSEILGLEVPDKARPAPVARPAPARAPAQLGGSEHPPAPRDPRQELSPTMSIGPEQPRRHGRD